MTIDEAIKHCEEEAEKYMEYGIETECYQCGKEHEQLAEWLRELQEAKTTLRVCKRMLGYLLDCEIENSSTRREVETLLQAIVKTLEGE